METYGFVIIIVIAIVLIALFFARPSLFAVRGGKILAFFAFFILPVTATVFGTSVQMEHSKSTGFCLSCHVMEPYGKSLFRDDPTYLPASHFQNHRIPTEQACFTCHTTYTMFGDINAKLGGLRHVYIYYLGQIPAKISLRTPFQNRECLHCHAGARSFEEQPVHQTIRDQLTTNNPSCLTCHNAVHNVGELDKAKFWTPPYVTPVMRTVQEELGQK